MFLLFEICIIVHYFYVALISPFCILDDVFADYFSVLFSLSLLENAMCTICFTPQRTQLIQSTQLTQII